MFGLLRRGKMNPSGGWWERLGLQTKLKPGRRENSMSSTEASYGVTTTHAVG